MTRPVNTLATLPTDIMTELQADAEALATEIFGDMPDASAARQGEFIALAARNWDDLKFRQSLLDRYAPKLPTGARYGPGVKRFNEIARAVAVHPENSLTAPSMPPTPLLSQPMSQPAPAPSMPQPTAIPEVSYGSPGA